jgi:hypothetical protein
MGSACGQLGAMSLDREVKIESGLRNAGRDWHSDDDGKRFEYLSRLNFCVCPVRSIEQASYCRKIPITLLAHLHHSRN